MSAPRPQRVITSVHGAGGRATARLVEDHFLPALGNAVLARGEDAAWVTEDLAVTTDAFVVRPAVFPGGDLGSLAVHGVVNDLAVMGARATWMTATFILEEGTPLADVDVLAASLGRAAAALDVRVVAADTKVVGRGAGDGVYVSAAAGGMPLGPWRPDPASPRPGDVVIVSGPVADHGVAVMTARGDLGLEVDVVSDQGSVLDEVEVVLAVAPTATRVLRDVTRGGLATVLNELVGAAGLGAVVREGEVPVRTTTRAVCELLGLDPLYVACEGRFTAIVAPDAADDVVAALRAGGGEAAAVGTLDDSGVVTLETVFGGRRRLDRLTGDPLPRIC